MAIKKEAVAFTTAAVGTGFVVRCTDIAHLETGLWFHAGFVQVSVGFTAITIAVVFAVGY